MKIWIQPKVGTDRRAVRRESILHCGPTGPSTQLRAVSLPNRGRSLPLLLALCAPLLAENQPEQPLAFDKFVGEIAEKEDRAATDYRQMAEGTLSIAQQGQQAGQMLPPPVIHDALDAVEAGRALNPIAADWDELQRLLEELLEQQEQQQQEQQSDSSQENGDESQESQEGQDQQQNDQQGSEGEQQDSQEDGQGEKDDSQSQNNQDGAQVGDLGEQEQPEIKLSQGEPGEEREMQSVGGQDKPEQQIAAENAAILQKLEQLKQQDDPSKLFQILQEAQTGEKSQPQPNAKDW